MAVFVGMLWFRRATLAIDPSGIAAAVMFLFPNRQAMLDFIDDESARIEGFTAVCGTHPDPHCHVAQAQRTDAMDAQGMLYRKAPQRFRNDAVAFFHRQLLKRFVLEAGDLLAFILIANPALETDVAA